jgi:plastocyanin
MKPSQIIYFKLIILLFTIVHPVQSQSNYRSIRVAAGGTIEGRVVFRGTVPETALPITKDVTHCGRPESSARLLVGADRGVQNAVVYLRGISAGKPFPDSEPIVLDQKHCDFEPRVLIVPIGTELIIRNSDAVLHNVHAYVPGDQRRTLFNIAQPVKGQETRIRSAHFNEAGLLMATCDAGHPWMNAFIMVAAHPYYALTDEAGRFQFTEVPEGRYEIVMWHEGVYITDRVQQQDSVLRYSFEEPYEIAKEVAVTAHGKTAVEFEFSLRSANAAR